MIMACCKPARSALALWSVSLLIAVGGCGAKPAAPSVSINGIQFELPWRVDDVEAIKVAQRDSAGQGITLANERYTLEVAGGRGQLNGKDFGPVNRGDQVRLTQADVVSVNGVERHPQDRSP
jgi:hypothetical protein